MAGMNPRDRIAMAMAQGGGQGGPPPMDGDEMGGMEPQGGPPQGGGIPPEVIDQLMQVMMPQIIEGVIGALKEMAGGDQGAPPQGDPAAGGGMPMHG